MASPKNCLDCTRVTFKSWADARAEGWVSLFYGYWNDLWRCPWCNR